MTRPIRWLMWGGIALLATCVVLALLATFLLGTGAGARLSWRVATSVLSGENLQLEGNVEGGTLWRGLRIENLALTQQDDTGANLQLQLDVVAFNWDPRQLQQRRVQVDTLELDGLRGSYQGSETPAPGEPLTQDSLRAMLFDLPVAINVGELTANDLEFAVDGASVGTDSLRAGLSLDAMALTLADLDWRWQTYAVSGNLQLDRQLETTGNVNWELTVADVAYAGQLQVAGNLDLLQVEHVLQQPVRLDTAGSLVPGLFDGQTVTLDLQHEAQALTLDPWGVADVDLTDLMLDTTGTPDDLRAQGAVVVAYPDVPATAAEVDVSWRDGLVVVDALQLDNPELAVRVEGSVTPSPLDVAATWELLRLDPGSRFPEFRLVDVTGEGSVALRQTDEGLLTDIDIMALEGELNERPLNIAGTVNLRDAVPLLLDLSARSGDNLLELEGSADEVLDLSWNLQAPALRQLWEGATGSIAGTGAVGGTVEAPEINGSLTAESVEVNQGGTTYALDTLTLEANYRGGENQVRLQAGPLSRNVGDTSEPLLDSVNLTFAGTPEQHSLDADIVTMFGDLALALSGGREDEAWAGRLDRLATMSDYGDWTLREPVAMRLGAESQHVDRFCLDYLATSVCAGVDGTAASGLTAQLELLDLPLAWLARGADGKPPALQMWQDALALHLPGPLAVEGTLDASAAVQDLNGASWNALHVEVRPADVVLQLTREQDTDEQSMAPDVQRFAFSNVVLDLDNEGGADSGDWQSQLAFNVEDEADGATAVQGSLAAQVSLMGGEQLGGTIEFDFTDLAWVESLAPMVRDTTGELHGSVELAGDTTRPLMRTNLQVSDAGFELPEYGLDLTDVRLDITSDGDNNVTATASMHSGEGDVNLRATLTHPLLDDREFDATLTGQNFTVMDLPEAQVAVSPDLTLHYGAMAVGIGGSLTVDRSNIDLAGFVGDSGGDAVSVSRDVVIVREEDEAGTPTERSEPLALSIDVSLRIGDVVTLTGYGLDVSLGGQLDLEQEPGGPLLTYGELEVPEGTYEIYNQQLSTRDGRLLFFGNPTNPVLDLRASRETPSAEVGIQLSGTLNRLQGQLYSTPTLPENEILALLVTGKSFNNVGDQDSNALLSTIANFGIERGQGLTNMVSNKLGLDSVSVNSGANLRESSLGLGKYITPNLLMQYEVGLFDRQFVLSLDYTLTERLKLEVETGVSQSVDISYTVEKD